MKRGKPPQRGAILFPLFVALVIGGVGGWWMRGDGGEPPLAPVQPVATSRPLAEDPAPMASAQSNGAVLQATNSDDGDVVERLRRRGLRLPLDGADVKALKGQFGDRRDGGRRGHEAVDLLAPRNTPVHAVDDGMVAKLFLSKAGGITVYQFDPGKEVCYYYAHLDHYAEGLHEGQMLRAGEVIGFVGTTGNAPPGTPHLHFALFHLTPERQWWKGEPLDPYDIFAH